MSRSERSTGLYVEVRNGNVDKAIRLLNRKVKQEGLLREVRARQAYEKPSDARRRREAESRRRIAKAKRNAEQV